MASAIRIRAATGLFSLSRAIPKAHPTSHVVALNNFLCQRRLFSHSSVLEADVIVKVPEMAESISEGTLASLPKKVGQQIKIDEEIASIETDKIDVTVSALEGGIIAEYFVAEGDTVVVGQNLARIVSDDGAISVSNAVEEAPVLEQNSTSAEPVHVHPEPTGSIPEPLKLDTSESVTAAEPTSKPEKDPSQAKSTSTGPPREIRAEKMTRMRKTIAAKLKQSQDTCASLTTVQEVDMANLIAWRSKYRDSIAEEHGVRLGYMGAFTKAATLAAQQVPRVNAAIDTEEGIITYRDYVDVSIAVSAPKGLVTPVIRNANDLSIVELERQVASLAKKARDGKLTMPDIEGGNFSISNPGIYGSMFGTPLINYPQAAVFNMNSIQQRVMAIDGEAVIRPMMYISLTYDHRLIESREAVAFLNTVKKYIEDPSRMLLV
ncbi:hypothetical protein BGZ63DRAFT_391761 [Mariannaea sp. PMI_226]|nr:hypothetical protein BGZ63DRAFT_391761 [Mariannaea sp. PMI_226]